MSFFDEHPLQNTPVGSVDPQLLPPEQAAIPELPALPSELFPVVSASPPRRDPVWSGWDVLLIALATLIALIVAEFVTIIGAQLLWYHGASFRDLAQKPSLALVGEILGYIAVAVIMIMMVEGKYHEPFWKAIRWNWHSRAVPKLLGLGVLTVGLDVLGRYLPMPKSTPFEQIFAHPGDAYLMAAFAVTFGPLMEELFFRGFLYPVLARRTGVFLGVVLTSLPFGLMHYVQYRSWSAVLIIACVGVVLTLVRVVTQSVAASFLVHVGYNATLMALTAIATDGFRHMEKIASLHV